MAQRLPDIHPLYNINVVRKEYFIEWPNPQSLARQKYAQGRPKWTPSIFMTQGAAEQDIIPILRIAEYQQIEM